jgi:hypothetical protein
MNSCAGACLTDAIVDRVALTCRWQNPMDYTPFFLCWCGRNRFQDSKRILAIQLVSYQTAGERRFCNLWTTT